MSKKQEAPLSVSPIPIDKIDQDVANHRLVTDPASDQQLLESIKANGVQQPIKVTSKGKGRFTLVFGFRRLAAAKAAGLKSIPGIVEQDLDINTIRQLQAIENLERKELHPLEEAEFCHELAVSIDQEHDTTAAAAKVDTAEAVAQRIGRSRKWVELRLSMARLSDRVKQAFIEGDIDLAHAQLIARLASQDQQDEVLGRVRASECTWLNNAREKRESRRGPSTISETRFIVESMLRDLSSVAWDLEAEFAELPACASCPHNTENRLDLFDGDEPKKPQCLEPVCFKAKTKAASQATVRAVNTLLKEHDKPTPAKAKKAIKEREVGFIKPKAVVEAAKRRQNPSTPTAGERRGHQDYERDWAIERELQDRHRKWLEPISAEINSRLPTEPIAIALLELLNSSNLADRAEGHQWTDGRNKKVRDQCRKEVREILEHIIKFGKAGDPGTASDAIQIVLETIGQRLIREDTLRSLLPSFRDEPFLRQTLCELLDIKVETPKPTRKQVEAELFPKKKGEAA